MKQYCVNYIKKIRTFRSKKNNFEYNPWFFLALGKYVETKNNRRSDKRKRKRLRGCDSNIPKKAISCFWSGIDIFFYWNISIVITFWSNVVSIICKKKIRTFPSQKYWILFGHRASFKRLTQLITCSKQHNQKPETHVCFLF